VRRIESSAADVHRFVARRVANPLDAADIAQQTLLVACAKLDTCRGERVSPWLFKIARHLIVDHYRAKKRFRFVEAEALAETEPALRTRADVVQAACECRRKLGSWLDCITQRLRLEEQVAVLLADVYGHRDKDSAELLRMSVPSFKLLLHGARSRLREVAGGDCALVGPARSADEPGDRSGCAHAGGNGGLPGPSAGPPVPGAAYRVAAICRLGASKLLSLRARLLEGVNGALAWLWTVLWPMADEGAVVAVGEGLDVVALPVLLWEAVSILAG
jgi:RNA polymerase sigma-70 factor (ECF subfamily)